MLQMYSSNPAVNMTAPAGKGQLLIGAQCDHIIKEEDDLRHN